MSGSGFGSDQKGPDPTGSRSATQFILLWVYGKHLLEKIWKIFNSHVQRH
jgi:hypothetical protein